MQRKGEGKDLQSRSEGRSTGGEERPSLIEQRAVVEIGGWARKGASGGIFTWGRSRARGRHRHHRCHRLTARCSAARSALIHSSATLVLTTSLSSPRSATQEGRHSRFGDKDYQEEEVEQGQG